MSMTESNFELDNVCSAPRAGTVLSKPSYMRVGAQIEGDHLFSGLAKKVSISEKSTIFVRSSRNLVKLTTSRGRYFDQVS